MTINQRDDLPMDQYRLEVEPGHSTNNTMRVAEVLPSLFEQIVELHEWNPDLPVGSVYRVFSNQAGYVGIDLYKWFLVFTVQSEWYGKVNVPYAVVQVDPIRPRARPVLLCIGCFRTPEQLRLDDLANIEGYQGAGDYVWNEEGTLNRRNGHFMCDSCYIKAGQPSHHVSTGRRWVAP